MVWFFSALGVYLLLVLQLIGLFAWYKSLSLRLSQYGFNWKEKIGTSLKIEVVGFIIADWFVDKTSITFIFFEPPRPKELVTTRMKRWRKKYEDKRPSELGFLAWHKRLFAIGFCDEQLDGYDPTGDHC